MLVVSLRFPREREVDGEEEDLQGEEESVEEEVEWEEEVVEDRYISQESVILK